MECGWVGGVKAAPHDRIGVPGGGEGVGALVYAHRMVLSPRAGYRTTKKAGSAVNRTIKQTKTATSILLPSVWLRIEAFEDGVC